MPKQPITIDRLDADSHYAAEALTLRVLTDGLARLERELDSIRIEDLLRTRPQAPNAAALRERLKKNQGAKQAAETIKPSSDFTPAIAAALALLQGEPSTARPDSKKRIAQLDDDVVVVRAGVMAQQQIVEEIRNSASATLALRLREQHRAMVLASFRAAQAYAAAVDVVRQFRTAVLTSGYTFRGDVLPEPVLRSALILGSESEWDSEVSRVRRLLEQLEILR